MHVGQGNILSVARVRARLISCLTHKAEAIRCISILWLKLRLNDSGGQIHLEWLQRSAGWAGIWVKATRQPAAY